MSQIKTEISLRTNAKLIFDLANLFNGKKIISYVIKIRESIDILAILHFCEKLTSGWYEG